MLCWVEERVSLMSVVAGTTGEMDEEILEERPCMKTPNMMVVELLAFSMEQ